MATAVREVFAALARSDADLLRRFASGRDEAAFAELVRRHGPLVLGVCRRVVGDRHLADDAFQAAFVVLARKAGELDAGRPLGPWLYGVAFRVALRARTMIGRRRKRETLAASVPDVPTSGGTGDFDVAAVVDEEVARLSAVCREAVVLCEMQGLSRKEAAKRLGVAEGTLSSRLAAARKTLAERLRARGVALGAGLFSTIFVPTDLLATTVSVSTGKVGLSPHLARLVEGATHMALLGKLKLVAVAVAFAVLAAGGFGVWRAGETSAAPVPKAEKDEGLIWVLDPEAGKLIAYTPDGDEVKAVKFPGGPIHADYFAGLSADGSYAMLIATDGKTPGPKAKPAATDKFTLHLLPLHEPGKLTDTGIDWRGGWPDKFTTSADGEYIYRQRDATNWETEAMLGSPKWEFAVTRFDRSGKNAKGIPLPDSRHSLEGVLASGDLLVWDNSHPRKYRPYLWPNGTDELKDLLPKEEGYYYSAAFSRDGKKILSKAEHNWAITRSDPADGVYRKLLVIDRDTGKTTRIDDTIKAGKIDGFWSPDGKRVAVEWHDRPENGLTQLGAGEIAVVNADGSGWKGVMKLDDPEKTFPVPGDRRQRERLVGWYPAKKNAPVPKVEKDDGLIWTHNAKTGELTAYTPDGKKAKELTLKDGKHFLGFTPDGRQILFAGKKGKLADDGDTDGLTLHLRDISDKTEGTDTGFEYRLMDQFVFSPDGKRIVRCRVAKVRGVDAAETELVHTLFDIVTKKETPIDLPTDHQAMQWAADGTWFTVLHYNHERGSKLPKSRWLTYTLADGKLSPLADTHSFFNLALSPDGATLVGYGFPHGRPVVGDGETELYRVDVRKRKVTTLLEHQDRALLAIRFSPDGGRTVGVKYESKRDAKGVYTLGPTRILVADADGKNSVELASFDNDEQETRVVGWFPSKPADVRRRNAPVPKAGADPGVVWLYNWQTGQLLAYRPNGEKLKEYALPKGQGEKFRGLTPDGTRFVFCQGEGNTLHTRPVGDDTPATDLGVKAEIGHRLDWSPDGKRFYCGHATVESGEVVYEYGVYTADGEKEHAFKFKEVFPTGWSADGKSLILTTGKQGGAMPKAVAVVRQPLDGGKTETLYEGEYFDSPRLSPDGKKLLGFDNFAPRVDDARQNRGVLVVDVATKKAAEVARREKQCYGHGLWSPDSTRVAYRWCEYKPTKPDRTDGDWHFVVSDADGKNEVTIRTEPWSEAAISMMVIAWTPIPADLKDAKPDPRRKNAPVPKAEPPEGVILVSRFSHAEPDKLVEVLGTDGKSQGHLKLGELMNVRQSRVSPDGKKLAFVRDIPRSGADPNSRGKYDYPADVYVVDLPVKEPPKEPVLKGVVEPSIVWAADGKALFVSSVPPDTDLDQDKIKGQTIPRMTVRYDVAAKTEKAVELPEFHAVQDVSADGKTLLTRTKMWHPNLIAYSTYLVPLDTLKPKLIGAEEDGFENARLSPDGTRVIGTRVKYTKSKEPGLFVADVAKGKVESVPLKDVTADALNSVAWAADGKRVAVLWRGPAGGLGAKGGGGGAPAAGPGREAHRITVMDADGSNAKTIREFKAGDWQYQIEWADPKLADAEKPAAPDIRRKNAPVPKAEPREGVIVLSAFSGDKPMEIVKPDGTPVKSVKPDGWFKPWQARLSADATRVAYLDMYPTVERKVKWWTLQNVRWLDLDAKEAKPKVIVEEAYYASVVMSADGKSVYYSHIDLGKLGDGPKNGDPLPFETWVYDTATEKKTRLKLPPDHTILDVSPDGKTLLTKTSEFGTPREVPYLVPVATLKPERLTEAALVLLYSPRFSPDGRRILWGKIPEGPFDEKSMGLFVTDVATRKDTKVNPPKGVGGSIYCWSPDGKRIAMCGERPVSNEKGAGTVFEVTVCDADGGNAKVIVTRGPSKPGPGGDEAIRGLDWR